MASGKVKYKTLDEGCTVQVRALSPDDMEVRLLGSARRRPKPSAGLTVNSTDSFSVGAMVVLDLRFAGQYYTYRSRGMVSWAISNPGPEGGFKLGVLVFGMDKLDPQGISVSMAPSSPLPLLSMEPESPFGTASENEGTEHNNVEDGPLSSFAATETTQLSRSTDPVGTQNSPKRETLPVAGELVSLCAVDLKIARWLSVSLSSPPAAPTQTPERSLHDMRRELENTGAITQKQPTVESSDEDREDDTSPYTIDSRPSFPPSGPNEISGRPSRSSGPTGFLDTLPPEPSTPTSSTGANLGFDRTFYQAPNSLTEDILETQSYEPIRQKKPEDSWVELSAVRAKAPKPRRNVIRPSTGPVSIPPKRSSMIPIVDWDVDPEVEDDYDGEGKMILAFERIHKLYQVSNREEAGAFAIKLARELIKCDAASCSLVSPERFELYTAARSGAWQIDEITCKHEIKDSLVGQSVRTGATFNISVPEQDERYDENFDGHLGFITYNLLIVPIQKEGYTIGAIELANNARVSGFVDAEVNILSYIAVALAECIETSLPLLDEFGSQA